jgi:8-oxo-dGTP diphosphatase
MSEPEKILYNATICFLVRGNEVLLAKKVRKIGAGKLNGYGGGIEPGQSIIENAIDEIRVESGGVEINPDTVEQVARVHFHNITQGGEKFCCTCEILIIRDWNGIPGDSDEMVSPTWFPINNLPIKHMMLADPEWIPLALDEKQGLFEAHVYYGPRQESLRQPTEITFVETL